MVALRMINPNTGRVVTTVQSGDTDLLAQYERAGFTAIEPSGQVADLTGLVIAAAGDQVGTFNALTGQVEDTGAGPRVTVPAVAPAPPPASTEPTEAQVLAISNLISQINSGQVGFLNEDSIVNQIRSIMGFSNDAAGTAQAKALFDTSIKKRIVAPSVTPPPGVPTPTPEVVPQRLIEPGSPAEENRALLERRLADQSAGDILRRVGQEQFGLGPRGTTGGVTGLSQQNLQALQNPFARFRATDPILNFNQPTPFDQAFASFLGGPAPTREALGTGLQNIISGALGNQQQQAVLEGTFSRPDAETAFGQFQPAFSAGIQPTVAGVAPRFQGNVGTILQNEFQNRLAADPLRFTNALQVLQDFQNRGFIPTAIPGG